MLLAKIYQQNAYLRAIILQSLQKRRRTGAAPQNADDFVKKQKGLSTDIHIHSVDLHTLLGADQNVRMSVDDTSLQ